MSRRTVVTLGLLALVVVCILIAVLVRTRPTPDVTPLPTPSPSASAIQRTLFVAVRDDTGEIADSIVMGAQATPVSGSWLSLQPGLGVDIDVTGTVTLAEAGPASPTVSAAAVGNQLAVAVAGGWVMDRLALAAMVDAVGGVVVDLPTAVVQVNPDGSKVVLAKPGTRRLYGPAAALYAVTLASKEPQANRMERFDDVWGKVIRQLPGNVDKVRSIVGSLGSSSRSSVPPDTIANLLLDYQTAMAERTTSTASLPASTTGVGATGVYTLIPAPTAALTAKLFSESLLEVGKNGALPRVRITAAGATNADFLAAKEAVVAAGYTFVWAGQRSKLGRSQVLVPNSAARQTLGLPVAVALGLPPSSVKVSVAGTVGSQGAVLLGTDAFSVSASPSASSTPSKV